MTIEARTKTVFFSSLKRRHYMTRKSAIRAEACALIEARHPSEKAEYENGFCYYHGFHWTSIPRSDVYLRRVMRLVIRATK